MIYTQKQAAANAFDAFYYNETIRCLQTHIHQCTVSVSISMLWWVRVEEKCLNSIWGKQSSIIRTKCDDFATESCVLMFFCCVSTPTEIQEKTFDEKPSPSKCILIDFIFSRNTNRNDDNECE